MSELTKIAVGLPWPHQYPNTEGARFNFDENGPMLIISYNNPSQREIDSIRREPIAFALTKLDGVIFLLYKTTTSSWSDCSFSACLYQNITYQWEDINEGQGLGLSVFLLDAKDNTVLVVRYIGTSKRFSETLRKMTLEQLNNPVTPLQHKKSVQDIYQKYNTKELLRFAKITYRTGEKS